MRLFPARLVPTLTLAVLAAPVYAQSPTEFELDIDSLFVIAPVGNDSGEASTQTLLGEISLNGQAEKLLDNGTRLRVRATLRGQTDHPQRPGGAGQFENATVGTTGAFSAIGTNSPIDRPSLRTRLETAYFQIDGGYGEVRIGKDRGVAARFFEGGPEALTHARLDSPLLDITGLGLVRTRHDLTGPSAKVSYVTPRLLGLRAGLSFTPEMNADGLDRRLGLGSIGLSNATELAINGSRYIRDQDLRLEGTLALSRADLDDPSASALYDDSVETWSAGVRVERNDWSAGVSWLRSDDGLIAGDYEAWSAGLGRRFGATELALSYGEADLTDPRPKTRSWRLGGTYSFSKNAGIALSYVSEALSGSGSPAKSEGIVVEITLSTQIFGFSEN